MTDQWSRPVICQHSGNREQGLIRRARIQQPLFTPTQPCYVISEMDRYMAGKHFAGLSLRVNTASKGSKALVRTLNYTLLNTYDLALFYIQNTRSFQCIARMSCSSTSRFTCHLTIRPQHIRSLSEYKTHTPTTRYPRRCNQRSRQLWNSDLSIFTKSLDTCIHFFLPFPVHLHPVEWVRVRSKSTIFIFKIYKTTETSSLCFKKFSKPQPNNLSTKKSIN